MLGIQAPLAFDVVGLAAPIDSRPPTWPPGVPCRAFVSHGSSNAEEAVP
jgi:hypothetical protein